MKLQSKTVGIIGGMGPLAAAAFMSTLVRTTPATMDQEHLHVVVDSDPTIPDRTAFLLGRGGDPRPALVRVAKRLESLGCEILVMPCNTAHAFTDVIVNAVSVEFVNWIDSAAEAVMLHSPRRVGVLATDGTLRACLYQRALGARGFEVVLPDEDSQRALMAVVYGDGGIKARGSSRSARRKLARAAFDLAARGADVVVLGCTEIALALPGAVRRSTLAVVDPADAVASKIVGLARAPKQ